MTISAETQPHDADQEAGSSPSESDEEFDPSALAAGVAVAVASQVRHRPIQCVAIALGTGYVLGGGVPRFVVRVAMVAGLRALGRAVLTSEAVAEIAINALRGGGSSPDAAGGRRRHKRKRGPSGRFTG